MILIVHGNIFCQDNDPVLDFYVKRAGVVYESRNPLERGVKFSFKSKSYYRKVDSNGNITETDSATTYHYYSFGLCDSLIWDSSKTSKYFDFVYDYPNVFKEKYIFNFFPNDTGAISLPIGFDTDSTDFFNPIGIAIIERNQYFLQWLYLYYPNEEHHKRFSRSFRFTTCDNYAFPDSIWSVGAKAGLLYLENYRLETSISDIIIYR